MSEKINEDSAGPLPKKARHVLLRHQSRVLDLGDMKMEKESQGSLSAKPSNNSLNQTDFMEPLLCPKTADLMDLEADGTQIAEDIFTDFGGSIRFFGRIATVRCFENNALVRTVLNAPGEGRVLVVDGAGSKRCALLGDQLGALAIKNEWRGVIIHGCVRDAEDLRNMPVGVKAIGTNPRKSWKGPGGEQGVQVHFAGVSFTPGHWLYADKDGVVISQTEIHKNLNKA
mmetsp:Transcript_15341/g.24198  ORF Transcript_15341/g.24198 Transcript_15341/m.24198 type:complete len:228 (+) Transcript_15341:101-784(+)|eukprot:CAMPEP_0194602528 /NCGR_PEP_ID=MMETSP0292-20121207/29714_1 /TAXON_ID=39354 /ORGANISM="Heterosigma akashiwo, Strain CCMP2393" /LENGTH=227 /DNA_ID=CAMNT_0039464809 /DNA_START=92 /DNA_END=775 /DNA_ORIENTATION=+